MRVETGKSQKAQGAGEGKGFEGEIPDTWGWNEDRQGVWSLLSDGRSGFMVPRSPLDHEVGIQVVFLLLLSPHGHSSPWRLYEGHAELSRWCRSSRGVAFNNK